MDICCVIPLYNKASTIRRALRSALNQTLPCTEILVVDDASDDDGAGRVLRAAHPSVRLLRRDRPGPGGYAARNLAIAATGRRWVAFLDADDIWMPTHLERLVGAVQRRPSAGGAFASRFDRWRDGDRAAPVAKLLLGEPNPLLDFDGFLRAWLQVRDCPVWTSASMFRRDLLLQAGLFPEEGVQRGGDKDLWLRIAALTPLVYAGVRTVVFDRTAPNKVTHTASTAVLPAITRAIARLLETEADPRRRTLLRRLANQEIRLYARQSVRTQPPPGALRRALYLPEGLGDWALLAGLGVSQPALASVLRALSPTT